MRAPRATVYGLLLDARAVATWQVPTGMTSEVHEFDPREGGRFRISRFPGSAEEVSLSPRGDHSGATVPELHRIP